MTILRIERQDYGGFEVWDNRTSIPIYFAPYLVATCINNGQITTTGMTIIDRVVYIRLNEQYKLDEVFI
jgi:hypothetical protein